MPEKQSDSDKSTVGLGELIAVVTLVVAIMAYLSDRNGMIRGEQMHVENQSNIKATTQAVRQSSDQLERSLDEIAPKPDVQVELRSLKVELGIASDGAIIMTKSPKTENVDVFRVINRGDATALDLKYRWRIDEAEDWSGETFGLGAESHALQSKRKQGLGSGEFIEFTLVPHVLYDKDIMLFQKASGALVLIYKDRRGIVYSREFDMEMIVDNSEPRKFLEIRFQ